MSRTHEREHGATRDPASRKARQQHNAAIIDLIELETAAADSCETAIKRLDTASRIGMVAEIETAHRHQIAALESLLEKHKASRTSAYHEVVDKARILFRQLEGDDGITAALSKTERELRDGYLETLDRPELDNRERQAINAGLEAIEENIERLG